jgi:hypothetical protein
MNQQPSNLTGSASVLEQRASESYTGKSSLIREAYPTKTPRGMTMKSALSPQAHFGLKSTMAKSGGPKG